MRIFVAGATGVLGRQAVRRLVEAGHDVTGVARSDEKAEIVRALGATPSVVDILDPVAAGTAAIGHDVVCNLATNIPPTHKVILRSAWRTNDLLHEDGSRILVDAAIAAGASHYLQHSSGFMYADGGDRWLDEDTDIDHPPHGQALVEAERNTRRFSEHGGTGIALRFGFFYGADAGTTRDQLRMARIGIAPVIGQRDGYYPAVHTDDVGTAVVAALRAPTGPYNICEDEPLTRREHAAALANALGVKKLRIPPIRTKSIDYIARSQRVSNRRFKEATGWSPAFPSVREGWPAVVAAVAASD